MTSNRPSGRSTSGGSEPSTGRRSARQQRLANRESARLSRAGTRGSGNSGGSLMLYTVIALLVAAVVILGAFIVTNQSHAKLQALESPNAPMGSAVTPTSIAMNGHTLGLATAPHTIDVYEDFQCPRCRDFTADIEPQIVANYVATGKAKLVWHDLLVIDSNTGGTESLDAANAARCAEDQGMFWPYHDWLYTNQYTEGSGAFTKDRLKTIGKLAGIKDLTKFDACVDNGTHNADVQAETAPAGVTSTPTVFVDGTQTSSYDYGSVSAALDKLLGVTPSPSAGASGSPTQSPSATAS